MLCSDLMKRDVERCLDSALVTEAALTMRDRNIGFLPVCSPDGIVVGVVTDRDIVVRVLAARRLPGATRTSQIMTREIIACRPDDELAVAEDLMMRHRKSRMLCLDSERRIAGAISLSDIAKRESQPHAGVIAAAIASREASAPGPDERPNPRTVICREVMKTLVHCCKRSDRIPEIAASMRDHNIGFIPVCDDAGAVVGTITDRDLTLRVVADDRFPITALAEHVLTPELVFCSPDDPLRIAEDLMVTYKKSRIVCADLSRRPLGVISLSDLARIERSRAVSRVLREVSSRPAAAHG
jgi:CBS domain-containing protein